MASSVSPVAANATADPTVIKTPADALAQKETFLKLLVAQIRHQNPLQPADAIQFVTQLAQFSQLEQLIAIRAELAELRGALAPDPETAGQQSSDQTRS